jgi:hypothetical protein
MRSNRFRQCPLSFGMMDDPDPRAHIDAIDDRLAPHAQIGNQFINGRDLIDFCACGALVPAGMHRRLMRLHHDFTAPDSTRSSTRPNTNWF